MLQPRLKAAGRFFSVQLLEFPFLVGVDRSDPSRQGTCGQLPGLVFVPMQADLVFPGEGPQPSEKVVSGLLDGRLTFVVGDE